MFTFLALLSTNSNTRIAGAHILLESNIPQLPKLDFPPLPKPSLPELPKPDVPKINVPELPKPNLPKVRNSKGARITKA